MKLNAGVSMLFLFAVTALLIHFRRFLETSHSTAIYKGLKISAGLWIGIIAMSLMHGFLNSPILEMEIFYVPLYPMAYFDEWMINIFNIDMGRSLNLETVTAFSIFTVLYQLCYLVIPTSIILLLKIRASSGRQTQ